MKNNLHILGILALGASLLASCGSADDDKIDNSGPTIQAEQNQANGSNIPYLKNNHANYKEHGSNLSPKPVKDISKKSIDWTIAATTLEDAIKLKEHLEFMEEKLDSNQNPRAWDKLFLMEAYMKYNKHYTTKVERTDTNIVVTKVANTDCAYEVISAHSDAVSRDFFAQGKIDIDYSSKAEEILAKTACDDERSLIEAYITQRQKNKRN